MQEMIVSTDGLNLRSSPEKVSDNVIDSLPLMQRVEVVTEQTGNVYWEVTGSVNGQDVTGFCSSRYLREPLSELREKAMRAAVDEWVFFQRGAGQEDESPYYERVGEYWQAIGMEFDGRDRNALWSAAFISFVMRKAGYVDFKFSDGHADYIRDAKKKRVQGNPNAPFWLFRLNEHKPKLGDLICGWREQPQTFDHISPDFFPSHTDLVVEVNDTTARTIGGNVDQSVGGKGFTLTSDGFVKAEGKLFAIMRNNK